MSSPAPDICRQCRGSGLNPKHRGIDDVRAGQYTDAMLCPRCGGEGVEPK